MDRDCRQDVGGGVGEGTKMIKVKEKHHINCTYIGTQINWCVGVKVSVCW